LKPAKDKKGYLRVHLSTKSIDGKDRTPRVHRLIAKTFIPNINNLPEINHINGIKDDNRIENLEWVTTTQNIRHAIKLGTRKDCKLSIEKARNIRKSFSLGISASRLQAKNDICKATFYNIINEKIWKEI